MTLSEIASPLWLYRYIRPLFVKFMMSVLEPLPRLLADPEPYLALPTLAEHETEPAEGKLKLTDGVRSASSSPV